MLIDTRSDKVYRVGVRGRLAFHGRIKQLKSPSRGRVGNILQARIPLFFTTGDFAALWREVVQTPKRSASLE